MQEEEKENIREKMKDQEKKETEGVKNIRKQSYCFHDNFIPVFSANNYLGLKLTAAKILAFQGKSPTRINVE